MCRWLRPRRYDKTFQTKNCVVFFPSPAWFLPSRRSAYWSPQQDQRRRMYNLARLPSIAIQHPHPYRSPRILQCSLLSVIIHFSGTTKKYTLLCGRRWYFVSSILEYPFKLSSLNWEQLFTRRVNFAHSLLGSMLVILFSRQSWLDWRFEMVWNGDALKNDQCLLL